MKIWSYKGTREMLHHQGKVKGRWEKDRNEVFVYMDACIRLWREGEKAELVIELYISSSCTKFSDKCICIVLIVNLPAELE